MPSLREEITRTFLRISGRSRISATGARGPRRAGGPDHSESYGPYRIVKRLGAGGMGQVYLALDTRLDRHVALKFLPPELTADEFVLRRFQQEARTASALNHPNILTIYEFPEIDGEHIIVSEFVDGVTLRSALDRDAVDLKTGIGIVMQAVSALVAAHAAGVVHRDLKPTNIMIRPDGYAKVIDFGLAKLTHATHGRSARESWTQPGSVIGTVDYMSPEQARGEDVDERTDIWSLGVILYEIATGQRPFQGRTESHVIVSILDLPPRPFADVSNVPEGMAALIQRCLAKDRKERIQTARQLLGELQTIQRATGSASDLRPFALPHIAKGRRTLTLFAVIAAALVIAFCVWWWPLNGDWKVLGPHWFEFDSTRRITFEGDVSGAAISGDGKYLAYTGGPLGASVLRIRNLQNGDESHLPPTADEYSGLTFSPDGKSLLYVANHQEVGRLFSLPVDRVGVEPSQMVVEDVNGPVVFSPGGNEFAFTRASSDRRGITNAVLIAGKNNPRNPRSLVSIVGTQIRDQLAWLPKRNLIAAVTYPASLSEATRATVVLLDQTGRQVKAYVPQHIRSLFSPVALDGGSLLVFSGTPEGTQQKRLVQLFIPTGEFHETLADMPGFESVSATADSRTLACVRVDQRSSVWVADAGNLAAPSKMTRDTEHIPQVAWVSDSTLVLPSARSGNENLALLAGDSIQPIDPPQACLQGYPAVVPGTGVVVYASNCAHGGDDFNIWSVDTKTHARRQLTAGSSYDYQPDVSPDGKWVFYTSWSSNAAAIWKIPVQGGEPIRVSPGQAKVPFVSPDGTKIVCQTRQPFGPWQIKVLSASDGAVLQGFPNLPAGTNAPVRWSPDGKALDFIRNGSGYSSIWRQPLTGSAPVELLRIAEDNIYFFSWNATGTKIAYIKSRAQRDVVLFSRRNKQ